MATRNLGSKGEAFQLEGQTWTCKNDLPSDVIIDIGEISFHLHKFPLLSRSGLLQKMINESHSEDGGGGGCVLQIHDLPGGPKTFELVAKFCYDVRFELNVLNAVPLRCAAEHLRMTEDLVEGNLAAQADGFLGEVFDKSWRDTMRVLETCEPLLPLAEELRVVSRCIDALAAKACADPTIFGWPLVGAITNSESPKGRVMWNGIDAAGEKPRSPKADWWYEDVATLSLPMYKQLILGIKSKGMRPETIAGSLKSYAMKHLPVVTSVLQQPTSVPAQSESEERTLVHEIFELLPTEKGACPTRFLVTLLRAAMILHASPSCCEGLERRVGAQLDHAALEDILIPNLGYSVETLYDVDCVRRIVESFMSEHQSVVDDDDDAASPPAIVLELPDTSSALTPMTTVAKLVDGYLAEVATDVNLKFLKFQSLAAAIPSYARLSDDGIYRAIDIYLKSHPWVSDADREQLCQLMNCQKLSLEACTHAAQNERLPLRVIVQVLFFEQLRLRTTIAGWFYVSDNLGGGGGDDDAPPHGAGGGVRSKESKVGGAVRSEITVEKREEGEGEGEGEEEMKVRVWELERECWKLKEELQKHGGKSSKGFWDRFCSKFGVRALGVRVQQQHGSPARMHKQCNDEQVSTQC